MLKRRNLFRKNILVSLGLIAGVVGLVWLALAYSPRSTVVNFQEYAPNVLPPHVSIGGRSLDVWSAKGSLFAKNKILTFTLTSPHSFISEERITHFSYTCNTFVRNQTCRVLEAPSHQKYLLTTSYDDMGHTVPFMQTVAWVRGDTHIWITLQGHPVATYSEQTWSQVVDSFHPVHYNVLTIKHYTPGP